MRALLYAGLLAAVAVPGDRAQSSNNCKYQAERNATIDAAGIHLLDLSAGAGSLKVEGKAGLTSIRVHGVACASDRETLDDIKLETNRTGSTIRVKANTQDSDDLHWMHNDYATLDVTIEVPAGLAANIDDGSGEMEVSGLGTTEITDGSGGIVASDLASVRINDGSGEIHLHDIHGAVDIEDGSGEIDVKRAGSVRVSDGSGGISVADVAGDFVVTDDGSGDVEYDNVRGHIDVPMRHHHRDR